MDPSISQSLLIRTPGDSLSCRLESRSPKFPPEITDMIIHHLHKHKPTLVACSAVSRSFIPLSRHYLFREIILRKVSALLDLLDSPFSTITPHIFSVTLRKTKFQQFSWSDVERILSLPSVKALSIDDFDWNQIPSRMICSVLSDGLPKLTVLRLRNIAFDTSSQLVNLLRAYPKLQGLEMYDNYLDYPSTKPIDPLKINMHVQKLHIGSQIGESRMVESRMLDWLLALPNVWPLSSLKIGPLGGCEIVKAWQFVQTLEPFLRDFVVFFAPNSESTCNFSAALIEIKLN